MEKGGRGTLRYQIVRLRFGRLFGFPRLRFSPFGYKASFSRRTKRLSSFLQVSHPVLCSGCCRSGGIRFFRFTAFFRHLLGRMAEQSQQLPSAFLRVPPHSPGWKFRSSFSQNIVIVRQKKLHRQMHGATIHEARTIREAGAVG